MSSTYRSEEEPDDARRDLSFTNFMLGIGLVTGVGSAMYCAGRCCARRVPRQADAPAA